MLRLTSILCFAVLPLSLPAQEKDSAEAVRVVRLAEAPKRPFLLEPGDYTVNEILDLAQTQLKRSYLKGDDVTGSMTASLAIRFPLRLDDDQLSQFVSRTLASVGVFEIRVYDDSEGGVRQLLSLTGPRRVEFSESARFRRADEVLALRGSYDAVMTFIPLRNAIAQSFAMEMRPFLSQGGQNWMTVSYASSGNALLVAGPACRVAQIIELAAKFDEAAPVLAPDSAQKVQALEARIAALEARLAAQTPQKQGN